MKAGKVRSYRDEVAAVAAVDLETAEEALKLIEVIYEPLPGIFDPEEAMLAGLLHDIGMVAVLSYAEKFPDIAADTNQIEVALNALHGQVGAMIMRKWGFSEAFVIASLEGDTWHRDPNMPVDYCDLVVVAQLHSWGGSYKGKAVPVVDKSASYLKLGLGEVTPEHKLLLLEEEHELVNDIQSFLRCYGHDLLPWGGWVHVAKGGWPAGPRPIPLSVQPHGGAVAVPAH